MKYLNFCFGLLLCLTSLSTLEAQAEFAKFTAPTNYDYTDCMAVFFNGEVLVDDYSPRGKMKLQAGKEGVITVAPVSISDGKINLNGKNALFSVGIKSKRTETIWMYTKEPVTGVKFEDVLKECSEGDKIIIMTIDKKYALPNNEIEVFQGC